MSSNLKRRFINKVFVALCSLSTLLAVGMLALILGSLIVNGAGGLHLSVFTQDQPSPGMSGGLRNAIIGSIAMCVVAMIIAVVLGIMAGTWLSEYSRNSKYGQAIHFLNDVLLSVPSILVGLFVYEIMVRPFHGFSAFAGAVSLALLAMPIVTRTTYDMLQLQPNTLREAGMGLGASQGLVIRSIIWKAAAPGLLTGGLLGFARISGETAPLLFTALGNQFLTLNMTEPMGSLPTTIFQFAMSAYDDWRNLAWVGALLIAMAVLTINILGRVMTRGGKR
ncbi:phosphate ABC transporter permease PstA [Zymomonas sp.]|uniref:phosphate ABC transporter permease PstA n=1 Tax=Zymomonas sp. TaxID=2068624 RepID=UPI0025DC27EC|nr:phosphate ABC transporter permease PstA [Zymomonas sp.]MCA1956736.1 phosphate ABC transporter permease PstA [Zymomonas sp.]